MPAVSVFFVIEDFIIPFSFEGRPPYTIIRVFRKTHWRAKQSVSTPERERGGYLMFVD
jgi:hypothetical protein